MMYNIDNIPSDVIDSWKTGNYGEDSYIDYESNVVGNCDCCGNDIYYDSTYYHVDINFYCSNCIEAAKDAIFELEEDRYRIN